MNRCLYITLYPIEKKSTSGLSVVTNINLKYLYTVFGKENVDLLSINRCWLDNNKENDINKAIKKIKSLFNFNSVGLTKTREKEILNIITYNQYTHVFIGQSLIGRLAQNIKKLDKNIKIGVFYHNCEYQYFCEYAKLVGKRKIILAWLAYYNEKKAIKYADYSFILNERDLSLIKKYFNDNFNYIVLPLSVEDSITDIELLESDALVRPCPQGLFVGSDFPPNIEALGWFVNNVLPYVEMNLIVVGKGLERYKEVFDNNKITIVGTVDELLPYYMESDFVVEPIFSGGGMKTKTAEALMYGKTILGTNEAFEGYLFDEKAMVLCNSDKEYIQAINSYRKYFIKRYNKNARELYKKGYSFDASVTKIKEYLGG